MTHPIKVSVILIFWGYCACAQTGGSSLFMKTIDKAESLSFQNIDSALYYGNEALQMGQKEGMKTLNMSLAELVKTNKITRESAASHSSDVVELERLLGNK